MRSADHSSPGKRASSAALADLVELIRAIESDGWSGDAAERERYGRAFADRTAAVEDPAADREATERTIDGRGPDERADGDEISHEIGDAAGDGRSSARRMAFARRRVDPATGAGGDPKRSDTPHVSTGWSALDDALGSSRSPGAEGCGLVCGAVHEWFGLDVDRTDVAFAASRRVERGDGAALRNGTPRPAACRDEPLRRWIPPLCILVHLAQRSLSCRARHGDPGYVVWIGRRLWPYPHSLLAVAVADGAAADDDERGCGSGARASRARTAPGLLERSIFIDPPGDAERLWAIDLALRCSAFAAVVADGSGLEMAQSRRLQLAAAKGGALVLLARPPHERSKLSAAATRWRVGCRATFGEKPKWVIELSRCKGRQKRREPLSAASHGRDVPHRWVLEQDRGQSALRVSADVADRPRPATPATTSRTA